jgi:transcriptional regulator GlxA family with amidase domain
MAITTGILLFDGVEELDFAGPWEVLTVAKLEGDQVLTIAEREGPITCAKGLRVLPDTTFADAPPLDVLLVPGGQGARDRVEDAAHLQWIKATAANAQWTTSVCTGALLLDAAGLTAGRKITTHWAWVENMREHSDATVLDDARYVVDGRLVTAAGVSAGIDMALWLVGEIYGIEHARAVQHVIQYDPEPPYTET